MTVCSICDKGFFSLCLLSKGQSFFLSYKKDRFSANERGFRKDSNSLKDIEILSFQKERLLSQANVLILIYKGQSSFRATQDDIASRNGSFYCLYALYDNVFKDSSIINP